jgi:glycosyltransferase involved in cell wall biosynthesis
MPAISIIMNVRNGAATLRDAMQSVLAQTFADWELIVWDDCSTDDSAEIVSGFRDNRIRYVLASQQTALGAAREAAIGMARGEWLAFLDQDDIWLPQKLEQQIRLTFDPQVGLVYGRTLCFFPDGEQRDYDYFHEFDPLAEGRILDELLGKGCFITMSSSLLRRAAVVSASPIPEEIQVTPDYYLYLAVCSEYEARAVQGVVCRYRIHKGSMTHVYRQETLEESLSLVERFGERVPRKVYERRRSRIATAIAFEEMKYLSTSVQGIRRLLREGSPSWLVGRPFAHLWRHLRRRIKRPYWTRSTGAS